MTYHGMQLEGAVRLVPVQEHRDRDYGDVRQRQGHNDMRPPRQIEYA